MFQIQQMLRTAQAKLHQSGVTANVILAERIAALDEAAWNSKATLLALVPDILCLLDPTLQGMLASFDESSLLFTLNGHIS